MGVPELLHDFLIKKITHVNRGYNHNGIKSTTNDRRNQVTTYLITTAKSSFL